MSEVNLSVKILVNMRIIKMSKKTITLDKNTESSILLFFLDVLVIFDTESISV